MPQLYRPQETRMDKGMPFSTGSSHPMQRNVTLEDRLGVPKLAATTV